MISHAHRSPCRRSLFFAAIVTVGLFICPSYVFGQPSIVPVQGYLTDVDGAPIDGDLTATFRLHATPADASPLFEQELDCDPNPSGCLRVRDGVFVVQLGSNGLLDLDLFADYAEVYLAIEIAGDEILPRVAVNSVAYAGYAWRAGAVDWSAVENVPAEVLETVPTFSASGPLLYDAGSHTFSLSSTGCSPGYGWVWSGSVWACEPAVTQDYTGGVGVTVDPDTLVISQNALTCGAGQYSRWNGSAWVCATDQVGIQTIDAGAGLAAVGNQVQVAAPTCGAGEYLTWNGSNFNCVADVSASYTGGNGIGVAGTTISVDAPSCAAGQYSRWNGSAWVCGTDQQGLTELSAGSGIGVAGNVISVAAPTCSAGEYLTWNGGAFSCVADVSASYTGGDGIDVDGTTVAVDSPTCGVGEVSRWNGSAWLCVTDQVGMTSVDAGPGLMQQGPTGLRIDAPACSVGHYSRWTGTGWACAPDLGTTYSAGNGISISGTTIATQAATCGANQYAYWTGTAWACRADQQGITSLVGGNGINVSGNAISTQAATCGANQYSYWTGTAWACRADQGTTYSAGNGISISGTTIATQAPACSAGQYSRWTGTAWVCNADDRGVISVGATHLQGTTVPGPQNHPILVEGTATEPLLTLNNVMTTGSCPANSVWRWTTTTGWICNTPVAASSGGGLTVSSGRNVSMPGLAPCGANEYHFWNGSTWGCRADQQGITSLVGGNGISVSGNTVSTQAATCAANHYSYWTGSAWACRADQGATYTGGNGINVSGTTISAQATTCAANQYSYWTGSAWACRADLRGVESVTGTFVQGSTVPGAQNVPILVTGTAANPQLSLNTAMTTGNCPNNSVWVWNTSAGWRCMTAVATTSGLGIAVASGRTVTMPGLSVCGADEYHFWNGSAWGCRASAGGGITTLTGGNGITVSGSGTSRTVAINSATCGANQVSRWTGSAWACLDPVVAGNGVSVSGRTVSINSATCNANQASRWTGTAWACNNITVRPTVACGAATLPSGWVGGTGQGNCYAANSGQRVIHGVVNSSGNIIRGSGFRVRKWSNANVFVIEFTSDFTTPPSVVATPFSLYQGGNNIAGYTGDATGVAVTFAETYTAELLGITTSRAAVLLKTQWGANYYTTDPMMFSFIAVGNVP